MCQFWDALGAISTTAAVIVALYQTHTQFRRKLKMSVNVTLKIKNIHSDKAYNVLSFNVTNAGNVVVQLEQWGLYINKTYYAIPAYADNISEIEQKDFPVILHPSDSQHFLLTHETLRDALQNLNIQNKKKKLICYSVDSMGEIHSCQSKQSISEIEKLLFIE